ncbi:MAG: GntR family transcriptional regulator [Anaerolineae bacterium]|nr:GntR family transcriptional regulator [Anaerolineae bacterium]
MASIVRDTPNLLYRQISAWLSQQIASGAWPEHYKLKAEVDLAAELGVNRGTLRKAIAELIEQGQLVRIHGRGTFVASKMLEQPLAERLIAVSEDLEEKGIPFETRVLEQSIRQVNGRIALLLGLQEGEPAFVLRRVRYVRQAPLLVLHNYVVPGYCPDIQTLDFERHGLFDTLEHCYHLYLEWGTRTFQAQSASPEIAELLEIVSCDPIMYLEQLVYLKSGEPVELSEVWIRGDRFRLSATLKRDPSKKPAESSSEYL